MSKDNINQLKNNVSNLITNVNNSPVVDATKNLFNNIFSFITNLINKLGLNFKIILIIFLLILIYLLYITFIEKINIQKKEVYYIDGRYTYNEAKNVCKSLNQRISTLKELYDNYKLGANWCKYGWLQSQIVAYPNQIKTTHCGKSGVNGNYQDNPNKNYGVVCIGVKPNTIMKQEPKELTTKEFHNLIDKISPFSEKYWSYNDLLNNKS